jgi:ABC-type transporter Mla maintaining outer membrane lipid asymmetry ATPase subunit MlaF
LQGINQQHEQSRKPNSTGQNPSLWKWEKIIEVRNLSKKFGSFTAVDNISFEVYKGEILVFLGKWSRKTTAMKMLIGISTYWEKLCSWI